MKTENMMEEKVTKGALGGALMILATFLKLFMVAFSCNGWLANVVVLGMLIAGVVYACKEFGEKLDKELG